MADPETISAKSADASAAAPPTAPAPLAYRAPPMRATRSSRIAQRVREFMRPDHLRDFGKTLTLVAPLTVLIWVWAEREQTVGSTESPEKQTFQLAVRTGTVGQTAMLASGQTDSVVIGVIGPKVGLDAMKDAVARDMSRRRMLIDIGDAGEPGRTDAVPLVAQLNQQKLFQDNGLTVVSAEPSVVQVFVDKLVERELPIKLPENLQDSVQSMVTDPKTVKVRGPERTIKQLEASGALKAELDINNLGDARSRGGQTVDRANVPIRALEGVANVTFDKTSVDRMTLQLSQEDQAELRSIAVYVSKPAGLNVATTVTPVVLTGVKVSGPSDVLRQLREEKIAAPYAEITITREDVGKRGESRTPTVMNLPPGVRVIPSSVTPVMFDVLESTASDDDRPIP